MSEERLAIFGLRVKTHGWGHVLTVLCPEGARRAHTRMRDTDGLETIATPGALTQYRERRAGAIDRLIARYAIVVLNHADWNEKKRALGARALR